MLSLQTVVVWSIPHSYNSPMISDKNLWAWKRKKSDAEPEKEALYSGIQSTGGNGDIKRREDGQPTISRI